MKRIPLGAWVKMFAIVFINMFAMAWGLRPFAEPCQKQFSIVSAHVTNAYLYTSDWAIKEYENMPSFEEIKDKLIAILTWPLPW